jgi:hypothetical protein
MRSGVIKAQAVGKPDVEGNIWRSSLKCILIEAKNNLRQDTLSGEVVSPRLVSILGRTSISLLDISIPKLPSTNPFYDPY